MPSKYAPGDFVTVPAYIYKIGLTAKEIAIITYLNNSAFNKNYPDLTWKSYSSIQAACGCTRQDVANAVKLFESCRLVSITRSGEGNEANRPTFKKGGYVHNNIYKLYIYQQDEINTLKAAIVRARCRMIQERIERGARVSVKELKFLQKNC